MGARRAKLEQRLVLGRYVVMKIPPKKAHVKDNQTQDDKPKSSTETLNTVAPSTAGSA